MCVIHESRIFGKWKTNIPRLLLFMFMYTVPSTPSYIYVYTFFFFLPFFVGYLFTRCPFFFAESEMDSVGRRPLGRNMKLARCSFDNRDNQRWYQLFLLSLCLFLHVAELHNFLDTADDISRYTCMTLSYQRYSSLKYKMSERMVSFQNISLNIKQAQCKIQAT